MLLNYHIGCIVLGLLCVGFSVRFGWGGIRAAGCSTTDLFICYVGTGFNARLK